jgi:hypothetical protein
VVIHLLLDNPRKAILHILQSDRLAVEFVLPGGPTAEVLFRLDGMDLALLRIEDGCKVR